MSNKYTVLEEKIKSMSAKEIILAMINGLKNPVVNVSMSTYGHKTNGICYGCAATNLICSVGGLDPQKELPDWRNGGSIYAVISPFLSAFEMAIDKLRLGDIEYYNDFASEYGFAEIKEPIGCELPPIRGHNYQDLEVLMEYEMLANYQDE